MKKKWGMILAVFSCLVMTANTVWADAGNSLKPDYPTDYYMIVDSASEGIDMYAEADENSGKLNDKPIVNGTALHIEGEKKDDSGEEWGYTEYHGMNGYVSMDELTPATPSEAAESEYNTFGGSDVDFDVKIDAKDGSAVVYGGPGKKFGEAAGNNEIENGQNVHISQEVQADDGKDWGKVSTDETEGWIDLDDDTDYNKEKETVDMVPDTITPELENNSDAAADQENKTDMVDAQPVEEKPEDKQTDSQNTAAVDAEKAGQEQADAEENKDQRDADLVEEEPVDADAAGSTKEKKVTPTPTKKATPTPKATPTEKATPTPKATPTEKATPIPKATPTPEATPTEEATPTPEKTPTPEATPTEEVTQAAEATATEAAETPEATPTEEATATPEATPTEEAAATTEATPTPEATPTEEAAETPEATPTEEVTETPEEEEGDAEEEEQKTSGQNVQTEDKKMNPAIWICIAGIVLIVLLLIYFLRKKNKEEK